MPFRPEPCFRRKQSVIYPLTEAIRRLYGPRPEDGAYPLGAFYTENISNSLWEHMGGISYRPTSDLDLDGRPVQEETVDAFMHSIQSGEPVQIADGIRVNWQPIPNHEATELESWRAGGM